MTADQLTTAREKLGRLWGLKRDLRMAELGRALRLPSADPGQSIRDYENGLAKIPGPVQVAVEMMLAGALPPDGLDAIRANGAYAAA
jgi:hypothetical protein